MENKSRFEICLSPNSALFAISCVQDPDFQYYIIILFIDRITAQRRLFCQNNTIARNSERLREKCILIYIESASQLATTFQASEEYREHSTHKTQRARKTQQRQNQHVVEQRSTTLQESSTVTTKRSSQQELSQKNFNVIRLNSIPLPFSGGGTVTCK